MEDDLQKKESFSSMLQIVIIEEQKEREERNLSGSAGETVEALRMIIVISARNWKYCVEFRDN
jgi:hypothetical protein